VATHVGDGCVEQELRAPGLSSELEEMGQHRAAEAGAPFGRFGHEIVDLAVPVVDQVLLDPPANATMPPPRRPTATASSARWPISA
jgi:hypothetical protein